MKPANLGIRSLAAIIDSLVVTVLWYFIIETWGSVPTTAQTTSASMGTGKELTGIPAILLMLATAAFWVVPEWLVSATPGKLLCGLKVVHVDGKKISFTQSIQRNLLRALDFFPFYLVGFVTAKLTPLHQRLGDLWAKTIVVKPAEMAQKVQGSAQAGNSN